MIVKRIGINFNGDLPKSELAKRLKIVDSFVDIIWIGDLELFEDPISLASFF